MATMSSRKSHTKSRSGCVDCKRRKIKCDEQKPECSNCRKHSISCSFVTESSSSDQATKPAAVHQIGTPSDTPNSQSSAAAGRTEVENGLPSLNLMDLELLHNFTTSTSATMSHSPILRTLWRVNVPKLGFENDYVMHGILAFSALHMARFNTSKKEFYFEIAESQHSAGLRLASPIIPHISEENCSAMYIFSALTSFYVLASRHHSKPDPGVADSLVLLRSTLSIVNVSWSSLSPGSLGPMFQIGKQRIEIRDSYTSMHPQLDELDAFCRQRVSDVAEREIYGKTIVELSKSFHMVYGRPVGEYEL